MSNKLKAILYTICTLISWPALMVIGGIISESVFILAFFFPVVASLVGLLFISLYDAIKTYLDEKGD